MFVKICGTTNESDALFAVAMGADAIGFVFAPSPRQVAPTIVRDIVRRLPAEILTVGVFRDEASQRVVDITNTCGLGAVQLHGHEAPAEVKWIRERVGFAIKAFSVGDYGFEKIPEYGVADAVLVDSAQPGSGRAIDWGMLEGLSSALGKRLILAGGLTADNVGAAIETVNPWGVDVVSGVESSPGHKDARKVFRFIQAAKSYEGPEFEGDEYLMPFDYEYVDTLDELLEGQDVDDQRIELGLDGDVGMHAVEPSGD
ncbi:MAG: phosphoribosylanthranilate isomerase [Actinobacteria bacterium]|nr:phosphoribosylanthranilate isomerase [Actinomycetota bacterium]